LASIAEFPELFENATDIILINDREGRIVAANRAAREFGGYTSEEMQQGVALSRVLAPDDYQAAMVLTQRALDGLWVPELYEREAVLRDGSHRFLELRSNVLRLPGRPPLLQTIGRDVTERKEAALFQAGMLQVSQALLTAQHLDQIGRLICEEASRVLHVDGAYLWLREGDELVGFAAAGLGARQFLGLRRNLNDSFIGQIYRAAEVLVVNNFQSAYAVPAAWRLGVHSMLAVPLQRTEPPVGVLVFTDSSNAQRFTERLRDQALIFGAQTTVAIESALAREREEEEGRVSAALLQVARDIRESLEEAAVLRHIAHSAAEVLPCDYTAVALWDPGREAFRVAASHGWRPDAAQELHLLDLRRGSLGVVDKLLAQQTEEIPEPRNHLGLYQRWEIESLLAVPMVHAGRVVGALIVGFRQRRGPFARRERRIAEGIAAQAAVAVDNARLVEDLRRANQLKSEFLGMMSHELRTPLNAILGYAELLRDTVMGQVSSEQAQALERILVNGRGLLEMINLTLDVNRLEAGRVGLDTSGFALEELFAELRTELAARLRSNDVTLLWPDGIEEVHLRTDRAKLKLVLRNLIDNALKFTPQGTVSILVQYDSDLERLWVAVRDTGVGIPASAQSSIFEMFQQLDATRGVARGGVGLGLYLVRRYVELLGGRVVVDSAPGAGSTFTIEIPAYL